MLGTAFAFFFLGYAQGPAQGNTAHFVFESTGTQKDIKDTPLFQIKRFLPIRNVYTATSMVADKEEARHHLLKHIPLLWLESAGTKNIHLRRHVHDCSTADVSFLQLARNEERMFRDPLYPMQWYLNNKEYPGNDINVIPVWNSGGSGAGVHICMVDDGLEDMHPDFAGNVERSFCCSFTGDKKNIAPQNKEETHGTRCAGQIVSNRNDICGVGIAPGASISCIKIPFDGICTEIEASAIAHHKEKTAIYSCSWGPEDDGKTVDGPDPFVLRSLIEGVLRGRDGLGSLYVFASGNGKHYDCCNFDGYVNSVFTAGIGAIDYRNRVPGYAEECSALLAVTYSSSTERGIATTDIAGKCTTKHGGTSAAVPIACGIYALVLEARPDLSWRDVIHLTVETATVFSSEERHWTQNSAGRWFSPFFGFGKLDAHKMVTRAKSWIGVGPLLPKPMKTNHPGTALFSGNKAPCLPQEITQADVEDLLHLESVTVTVTIEHTRRGALEFSLVSPSGTEHRLAKSRERDSSGEGLNSWTFSTPGFWGEQPVGRWKFCVRSSGKSQHGRLVSWRLALWGETTEARLQRYTQRIDYSTLLLLPYFPTPEWHFNTRSPYYHDTADAQAVAAAPTKHCRKGRIAVFLAALGLFAVFAAAARLFQAPGTFQQ